MVAIVEERDILSLLLGKAVPNLDMQQLEELWIVIANGIYAMYRRNLRLKEGIG